MIHINFPDFASGKLVCSIDELLRQEGNFQEAISPGLWRSW
ncbi:hypothetical protein ARZXY2_1615 [Arthrobacter sp. ZXY-2]|nr:hypothetical protein ARZXY2_1615 [Arthrobacter sp. ZXY-2]